MRSSTTQKCRKFAASVLFLAVLTAINDSMAQAAVRPDLLENLVNRDVSDIRADLEDGSIDGYRSKTPTPKTGEQISSTNNASRGKGQAQDARKSVASETVEKIKNSAEQGDSEAQLALGVFYEVGEVVPQDDVEAVKWFRASAKQENANGCFKLAQMCANGRGGLPKDEAKALELFKKSAELGSAFGQALLGILYLDGNGVPKDATKAIYWLEKSAAAPEALKDPDFAGKIKSALARAKSAAANPNSQTDDPLGRLVKSARSITDSTVAETSAAVKDPEPEKFGGPSTETIVRIVTSSGESINGNPQELANIMLFTLIQKAASKNKPLIQEIKRGRPLTSLISAQIPTGTEVFPIRLLIASALGPTQSMDFYFYKNEFDDWAAVSKPD
jgi:hypothetical protein